MSEQCLFCNEHEYNGGTFAETDLWRARWDGRPATPGHALLIPKRHAQYFEELTDNERDTLLAFARTAIDHIKAIDLEDMYTEMLVEIDPEGALFIQSALKSLRARGTKPDAFNYGVNDGPEAGQSVPHFHFHIMPRWAGDMANPRGGVRNLFASDAYKNLS